MEPNYCIVYLAPIFVIMSKKQYDNRFYIDYSQAINNGTFKLQFPPFIWGWYETAQEANKAIPYFQKILNEYSI